MGLITKEVEIYLTSKNIKWFEDKGYKTPIMNYYCGNYHVKRGTKILVKVNDLPNNVSIPVDIECDGCEKELIGILWYSYIKNVKDDGSYYCHQCANAGYKKWVSFYEWCYINLSKEEANIIMLRWDYDLNIKDNKIISPKDVSYSSAGLNKKGYWFKCLDHPEHKSEQKSINGFTLNGQNGYISCNQCNTIAITHPHLIKLFINKEDTYKYSMGSHEIIFIKCPDCGYEKEIRVADLTRNNFRCDMCSDNIPYGEKFFANFLKQILNDNYEIQLSKNILKWCNNYRYDFYISDKNCIVETHGKQHYEEHKNSIWGSLTEIQENDKQKEMLAKENGISNYIVINCKESNMECIKDSIMNSKPNLPKLLNFKEDDIDWLQCHEFACKNLVKTVCDLWNDGINNSLKIAHTVKLTKNTVIKYLKQGAELGWCDYDPKEQKGGKKIICLTTGEIFNSISDVGRKYNINISNISECCRFDKKKYAGTHPETKEKMIWMFYDNYITKSEDEIKNIINNINYQLDKRIICLTTNEIFNTQNEASIKYNIDDSSISACCKNKIKSAGKHPETNKKLAWMYYNEYILKTKDQLKDILNNNQKRVDTYFTRVICLVTGEIFNSQAEAKIKYTSSMHISDCCKGKRKSSGKLADGTKLTWMYYDEYINNK